METTFKVIGKNEPVLTGDERYPVMGTLLPEDQLQALFRVSCAGTRRHWDCQIKAEKLVNVLPNSFIVLGSLYVWSDDLNSNYGYEFNPPFEFHAWLVHRNRDGIIGYVDLALPGVVEMGLNSSDSVGPIVKNREPVILCGTPESWLSYRPRVALRKNLDSTFMQIPITHDVQL